MCFSSFPFTDWSWERNLQTKTKDDALSVWDLPLTFVLLVWTFFFSSPYFSTDWEIFPTIPVESSILMNFGIFGKKSSSFDFFLEFFIPFFSFIFLYFHRVLPNSGFDFGWGLYSKIPTNQGARMWPGDLNSVLR